MMVIFKYELGHELNTNVLRQKTAHLDHPEISSLFTMSIFQNAALMLCLFCQQQGAVKISFVIK
jgi:hypothetical protein